ncbi:MAG: hypothetical protein CME19_00755 [Gemmatimonadetes bacterium]|nr:hypothetical protein [Gemmatimonadota bacterium]
MTNGLRVGVIGASGIGQHHARWHALSGNNVVAFVGTSDASVARTRTRLTEYFGFSGTGYTSVSEMLDQARPEVVVVSSPYSAHKSHALEALSAGAHLLCEKPLVWDEHHSLNRILNDGRDVVKAVKSYGHLFCMTAQYPACLPMYRTLYERVRGSFDAVESIHMEMEVRRRGDRKLYEANWIDVASHPLSLVIALFGQGRIVPDTAHCTVEEAECKASFAYEGELGSGHTSFTIRDIVDGAPMRRFGVNDFLVDWDGFADEDGIYRASLSHGDQTVSGDDFLHTLIQSFSASVAEGRTDVAAGPDAALLNLEMQVELLRLARTGADAA